MKKGEARGVIVVASIFFLGVGGLYWWIFSNVAEENETKSEKELIVFKDSQGAKGEFFLGCGTIESVNHYLMYAKDPDGGIKQIKTKTDETVIYEEDRKDGCLEIYETRNGYGDLVKTKYFIRVPKGTVIRQFKADLD